jgi:hypothetical protein
VHYSTYGYDNRSESLAGKSNHGSNSILFTNDAKEGEDGSKEIEMVHPPGENLHPGGFHYPLEGNQVEKDTPSQATPSFDQKAGTELCGDYRHALRHDASNDGDGRGN